MKVLRAKHAGACYGVERALDMAYAAAESDKSVYTLGPLIHNPQVVEKLKENNVHAVKSPREVAQGTVIIRSHGVEPRVKRDALSSGLTVIDATCPYVARAQNAAADLADQGYHVVVVGECGHPEIKGLVAYAEEAGGVVSVVKDETELPEKIPEPVGVVIQTTQSKDVLDRVVTALQQRGLNPCVKDTICSATTQRQEAIEELSRHVDALVVIGGRNSSNTTRLFDIGKAHCATTYHIESPHEIEEDWFNGCRSVGVSAGASTPEDQIQAVIDLLETL